MQDDNRRSKPRLFSNESISLQLTLPGVAGLDSGHVVTTHTVDISPKGLRVHFPEPVPADHLFDLVVELEDHHKRFLLTGEVRWCEQKGPHDYEAGILIHEADYTDYQYWNDIIHGRISLFETGAG